MLIFCTINSCKSASSTFEIDVDALLAKACDFSIKGYSQDADNLARQITSEIIDLPADRAITVDETNALITVFLKTELYYAFNTKWGSGKTRDPRLIYDFLSQLGKEEIHNQYQRQHLTNFSVLSLAAQEYFWNEKSTVNDLRNRAQRELKYQLYNQPGHALNVSMLIYLDDASVHNTIQDNITESLLDRLKLLMDEFKEKKLGATYTEIFDYIEATAKTIPTVSLPVDSILQDALVPVGFPLNLSVKAVPSFGDGMCGQHSLFITTDGALESKESGIAQGNGRAKMLSAILDNASDPIAKRLYLRASQYMDGFQFVDLINKQIAFLTQTDPAQAQVLQEKLDAYKTLIQTKQAENEAHIDLSKRVLIENVTQLAKLELALNAFQTRIKDSEQLPACIVNRNFKNIIDEILSLRDANIELENLLVSIDDEILRLNTEISEARKVATITAREARLKAEQDFRMLETDFIQFQSNNRELVTQHQILFSRQQQFVTLMQRGIVVENAEKIQANIEQQFKEFDEKNPVFVESIREKSIALKNAAETLAAVVEDYSKSDAKLIEKYTLICRTLQDFIGSSMLPGKNSASFSTDNLCAKGYSNFVNGICQEICAYISDEETATACREAWDTFDSQKEVITNEMEQQLLSQRLEIAASLTPTPEEISPHSLSTEMAQMALKVGELGGELPCDATYTQLWAILNNLNIFVFSSGEAHGRSKLDLMTRLEDQPYTQKATTHPADISGKHLATVILTSPTARNLFLDKSALHYDKFILPNDYVAIAKQMRHIAWAQLGDQRYATYPQKIVKQSTGSVLPVTLDTLAGIDVNL